MTTHPTPEALAAECEESAQAWANEIDTRTKAAAMLRTLSAELAAARAEAATERALSFRDQVAQLEAERDGLNAARIAYASEFPLNEDGEPDTGSIHANIRALKAERDSLRAEVERMRGLGEADYKRGRRDGYNQRDDEVKGALT